MGAAVEAKGPEALAWLQQRRGTVQTAFNTWMKGQPPAVEVALAAAAGSLQGGVLGGVMGKMQEMQPPPAPGSPMAGAMAARPVGGPLAQARNFAVLTGVHAGLSSAMKKARGGVEDVKNTMVASFGAGVAFTLASGAPGQNLVASCLTTGTVFALLQGGFYKLGKAFQGRKGPAGKGRAQEQDPAYYRTDLMLQGLGLGAYAGAMRQGLLADTTLPLLTDSALKDTGIPPGPRLLILDHVARHKKFYQDDLKEREKKLAEERAKYN